MLEEHEFKACARVHLLGILLSSNLSWSRHINNKCNKARRLLGFIFRRFGSSSSCETLRKALHQLYVRHHLEYTATLWDPHIQSDISRIESVQRFACKVCMKWKHFSYEDMLIELELLSLQSRRGYLKLCMFFKLCTGCYAYPNLCLSTIRSTSTRSSNFSLCIPFCCTHCYLYYFSLTVSSCGMTYLKVLQYFPCFTFFSFKHYLLQ